MVVLLAQFLCGELLFADGLGGEDGGAPGLGEGEQGGGIGGIVGQGGEQAGHEAVLEGVEGVDVVGEFEIGELHGIGVEAGLAGVAEEGGAADALGVEAVVGEDLLNLGRVAVDEGGIDVTAEDGFELVEDGGMAGGRWD